MGELVLPVIGGDCGLEEETGAREEAGSRGDAQRVPFVLLGILLVSTLLMMMEVLERCLKSESLAQQTPHSDGSEKVTR